MTLHETLLRNRLAELDGEIASLTAERDAVEFKLIRARDRRDELLWVVEHTGAPAALPRRPKRDIAALVRHALAGGLDLDADQILKRVNRGLAKAERVPRRGVDRAIDRMPDIMRTDVGFRLRAGTEVPQGALV